MGRVTGFSGRVITDSVPKYLNTPETPIFNKGKTLYGLNLSKGDIRQTRECIVVEGYMDVIALHQCGITTAVASLGTAFTNDHAIQLRRLNVDTVHLAFDTDIAGQKATLAGLDKSIGENFLIKVVTIPNAKDPADALLNGDNKTINTSKSELNGGLSEVVYRFESVLEKHNLKTSSGKREILNELLPTLTACDAFDPVVTELKRLIVDRLDISGQQLNNIINANTRAVNTTQVRGMERKQLKPSQIALIELEVIALLLSEPNKLEERLKHITSAIPEQTGDSLLFEFRDVCYDYQFNEQKILLHYRTRDVGRLVYARVFSEYHLHDKIPNVSNHIEKSLSLLRERYLEIIKEESKQRLNERLADITAKLTNPDLPIDDFTEYYQELKDVHDLIAARDAERQLRHGYKDKKRH